MVTTPRAETRVAKFLGVTPHVDELTPRQREVFFALGLGLSTRQIANRLAITEHTVKVHTTKILGALRLESRLQAGLVSYVYTTGCKCCAHGDSRSTEASEVMSCGTKS